MKLCGIVAEYDPFHNGHAYHIEKTRQAGATHVVAVMSGCFVQRGQPALLSKFQRARLAVLGGADLVVELPVQYAVGSAERFARGAVSVLRGMGCVDMLSFGSECGDIGLLCRAAEAVRGEETAALAKTLYEGGESWPAAMESAVRRLWGDGVGDVLTTANNTLGMAYLNALARPRCAIEPVTVRRAGAGHNAPDADGAFASASLVRELTAAGKDAGAYVPAATAQALQSAPKSGGLAALSPIILYKLRSMAREEFLALPDCADGLADRLFGAAAAATDAESLLNAAKTKRYTMARVRRAVICALLGISAADYFDPPYIRVLAMGPKGGEVLARIDKHRKLPLSHSLKVLAEEGGNSGRTALLEARATDIFNLSLDVPAPKGEDYTHKIYTKSE